MSLMMKRKSIRKYTNEEISDEVIYTLIKSGMQAPSACNQQPWEFVIIDDKNILNSLSKISSGAWMLGTVNKAIAVVMTETEASPLMREQDCAAATQNILLEATNQDLGACWIGIYPKKDRMQVANQLLNVPSDKTVFSLISIGVPLNEETVNIRFDKSRIRRNKY